MKIEFRVNGFIKLLVEPEDDTEKFLLGRLGQESEKGITFFLQPTKEGSYLFTPAQS